MYATKSKNRGSCGLDTRGLKRLFTDCAWAATSSWAPIHQVSHVAYQAYQAYQAYHLLTAWRADPCFWILKSWTLVFGFWSLGPLFLDFVSFDTHPRASRVLALVFGFWSLWPLSLDSVRCLRNTHWIWPGILTSGQNKRWKMPQRPRSRNSPWSSCSSACVHNICLFKVSL